jgi:hypothetical protein
MIVVVKRGEADAPAVICDHCLHSIENLSAGVILHPKPDRKGERMPHFHVHRGECNEVFQRRRGVAECSDDLDVFYLSLLANLGVSRADLNQAIERHRDYKAL